MPKGKRGKAFKLGLDTSKGQQNPIGKVNKQKGSTGAPGGFEGAGEIAGTEMVTEAAQAQASTPKKRDYRTLRDYGKPSKVPRRHKNRGAVGRR